MALSLDKAFGVHEAALKLRAARTEVLANNIANADTPGYKARDIDFRAALNKAVQASGAATLKRTHPCHIDVDAGMGSAELKFRQPFQSALDGNTVEMQVEQAEFARNALEYQASLKFLEGEMKGLMQALKGE